MKMLMFIVISSIVLIPISIAIADVPRMLNYQGYVEGSGGGPTDGPGYFKFAIVNQAGDTSFWSNDGSSTTGDEPTHYVTIAVSTGFFTLKLGDTDITNMAALDHTPFKQQNIYVRVWFSDSGVAFQQLTPDTQIASAGFAYKAQTVEEVPPGTVDFADIANIPPGFADGIVEPGVEWFDGTDPFEVAETVGSVSSITVNAPSSGFVIVTSSGWINWLIQSVEQGVINLGISQTDNSIDSPFQSIGSNGISANDYYPYQFSMTKVFPVNSGNNTFYFNCEYSEFNALDGRAWIHGHTLVGLFVPNKY